MGLLLISGSLRDGSTNTALLRTAQAIDPDTERFDGMRDLPHFSPDDDGDDLPAAVRELRAATDRAAALLVCTPEYAGALPGAFKNLLEWLVGGGEAYRKPIAWINVSGPASPTSHSSRFLNAPGRAPAYSGVHTSSAAARSVAARSSRTAAGRSSPSSSGLKCGSARMSAKSSVSGSMAWAVRSSAVFVDPSRRLPEMRSRPMGTVWR